jgi:hypothetical protein
MNRLLSLGMSLKNPVRMGEDQSEAKLRTAGTGLQAGNGPKNRL